MYVCMYVYIYVCVRASVPFFPLSFRAPSLGPARRRHRRNSDVMSATSKSGDGDDVLDSDTVVLFSLWLLAHSLHVIFLHSGQLQRYKT